MNKKKEILQAGIKAWHQKPQSVTASNIGRMIGLTHAGVLYHFPKGLKDAVAQYAMQIGDKRIIAQLIAEKHKIVAKLTKSEKLEIWQGLL